MNDNFGVDKGLYFEDVLISIRSIWKRHNAFFREQRVATKCLWHYQMEDLFYAATHFPKQQWIKMLHQVVTALIKRKLANVLKEAQALTKATPGF